MSHTLYTLWKSMPIVKIRGNNQKCRLNTLLFHNGLLPKFLFAWSKTLFDKSKTCSRRFVALRAQTVQIADLPLRQDLLAKNVLMTAQMNFCLGNSLLSLDKQARLWQMRSKELACS
jgi:hypothetical protein